MIDKLSNLICTYINTYCEISDKDNLKINYALVAIIGESFKLLFLTFIFLIMNKFIFFLFSLTILILIRSFSGGLHFNTFNKCLLFSTLVFILTSLLAPILPKLPKLVYYFFSILSILLIYIKSPCLNPKRSKKNKRHLYSLRMLSTFFTIFCLIILFLLKNNIPLLNCGFFTILIQSIQLILASHKNTLKDCFYNYIKIRL